MDLWIIGVILLCGAVGGFVNVFIGDSGLHLPNVENGIFRPGFIGIVFVGMVAALASWGTLKAATLNGPDKKQLILSTSDIGNALLIGFGGAKWFKSEGDKRVLQKAAGIAANKSPDAGAAAQIATATPMEALKTAINMK
jgi:hypothetical protein